MIRHLGQRSEAPSAKRRTHSVHEGKIAPSGTEGNVVKRNRGCKILRRQLLRRCEGRRRRDIRQQALLLLVDLAVFGVGVSLRQGTVMWKKVSAPPILVSILWIAGSSITNYYVHRVYESHARVMEENVATIRSGLGHAGCPVEARSGRDGGRQLRS